MRSAVERGQLSLQTLDIHQVSQSDIASVVTTASADLDRADAIAHSSRWLGVLDHVPVLSNQVAAIRDLADASATIGRQGRDAADRVQRALDASAATGAAGRVALVDEVHQALDDLKAQLHTVPIPSRRFLLPPIASARNRLVDRLDKADRQLADADKITTALRAFLAGPRHYLILGGNNAEMRALPIATTAGPALVQDGEVKVGDFLDVTKVDLPYPGVSIPAEWDPLYQWLGPGQAYTSAVMSPNFPRAAEVSSRISQHNAIGDVEGVIYVDTVTLQSLLNVIGPVTVDGTTYDGTNAAQILINQNYLRFQTLDVAPERREAQGRVAKAIFEAINARHFPLTKLAATLLDLTKERHLLAWSSDPAENEMWNLVGASGDTAPDNLLLTSQDLGGSKLDYYVTINVKATIESHPDHRQVHLDITLTNPKRKASSAYIDGGSPFAQPGEYGSFLALHMPKATLGVANSDPGISRIGPDGNVYTAVMVLRVPQGTSKTVSVDFSIPRSEGTIEILPSARLNPITYEVNGKTFSDLVPVPLDLAAIAPDPAPSWAWLTFGLLFAGVGMVIMQESTMARARDVGWTVSVAGLAGMTIWLTYLLV